jgi:hypothetical protein
MNTYTPRLTLYLDRAATTATDHPRFTDARLADLGLLTLDARAFEPGGTFEGALSWTTLHDLALDLQEAHPHLTFEDCQALVSGTVNGLPLTVTYTLPLMGGTLETVTESIVVPHLSVPGTEHGRMRVRAWGGSHDVHLSRVKAVEVASATRTYEHPEA